MKIDALVRGIIKLYALGVISRCLLLMKIYGESKDSGVVMQVE